MLKKIKFPDELVEKVPDIHPVCSPFAEKLILEGIDELQYLYIAPWTHLKKHGHDDHWEIWLFLSGKAAYVCMKDEEHELINHTGAKLEILAIKGHNDYSFDDISEFLKKLGFTAIHDSVRVIE